MDGWMDEGVDGWIDGWMGGWMDGYCELQHICDFCVTDFSSTLN